MFWGGVFWLALLGAQAGAAPLIIARDGATTATVAVAADAGRWERQAARDLVHYIFRLSNARPALAETPEAIERALAGPGPVLLVGRVAVERHPELAARLAAVARPAPVLRADAVALVRRGRQVFLAGTNDDAHYYAVAELLRRWGCRWFMPGDFGESIPEVPELRIDVLDHAHAPPFEVRRYWLSWLGEGAGRAEFMRRNFFNDLVVPNSHALGRYTRALAPAGGTVFNVPIAEDRTAEHVARQILPAYAAGKDVSLGMEDGVYSSDSPEDAALAGLRYDKYVLGPSYSDAFMVFYNKVAARLRAAAPDSRARLGFLIYANITLPPVRPVLAEPALVGYLAPIDFDPIHGIGDPRSPNRGEYAEVLRHWARIMGGRLVIYDYDQSMLVWRDLPNPSIQAFRRDVRAYRESGILGVDTESRGALATTFLNLYLRGQLLWNPEADPEALLADFYPRFYGPAGAAMAAYWAEIFRAWDETLVTEHEHFVAPALYTPALLARLARHLESATAALAPYRPRTDHEATQWHDRLRFTRLGFEVLERYMEMVRAAASEADYAAAVRAGEGGLAARERLTDMNPAFTTYRRIGEKGPAWWPGEVRQYRELAAYTDGSRGERVAVLPVLWDFRTDPDDRGVAEGWPGQPTAPGEWSRLRSDLYLQAQGVLAPDGHSYTGHAWYRTALELTPEQAAGRLHLRFPGLFNEAWLYVNGEQVAHRPLASPLWWRNDYRFEWDVALAGKLRAGANRIDLRIHNPHHFGGLFRRPFVYRAVGG